MGFFNYFIKCIIRNITYKLCKPKVFLTVLLAVLIILLLHNTGYCAWDDADINFLTEQINSLIDQGNNHSNWLVQINTTLGTTVANRLDEIKSKMDNQNANLVEIKQELIELNNNVSNILKQLTGESSTFSFPLKSLLYCESIPDLDYGADVQNFQIVQGNINCGIYKIDYSFKAGTTYTFSFDGSGNGEYSHIYYTYDNAVIGATVKAYYAGTFYAEDLNFSITPENDCTITLLVRNPSAVTAALGNWVVTGVKQGLINELQGTMDKNNQLQQEQNQLQQEQNDFLKQEATDDDVSVDSFNSVDSNDITSDGLTGIFTNIYNSITSWSSKDISLPIPYTNKSIVIPADYTENMLSSFGGGWIITFISSIYYFIVARFIIYSITSIINSIKSGSILETDSKNNITTDML